MVRTSGHAASASNSKGPARGSTSPATPSTAHTPDTAQLHLVTVVAEQSLAKGDKIAILKQVFSAVGASTEVTMMDTQGKTMRMVLRTRPSVAKIVAAGLTLHGTALTVIDGEHPSQPPGIRVMLVNLPMGWTIEQVRKDVKGVRHVKPHRWRDETKAETGIWLTSATVWLEPDSVPVRRVKIGSGEATVIDPRLPKGKRRRRSRGRKSKGNSEDKDKDKGKGKATETASAASSDAIPMETSSGPPTSPPASSVPILSTRTVARVLFATPSQDLVRREEEWHLVESRRKKKIESNSSSASNSPPSSAPSSPPRKVGRVDEAASPPPHTPTSRAIAALSQGCSPRPWPGL